MITKAFSGSFDKSKKTDRVTPGAAIDGVPGFGLKKNGWNLSASLKEKGYEPVFYLADNREDERILS